MQYPPSEGGRSVGYPPSQPPDQHYMGPPGMYNNTQEKYVEEVRVSTQCFFSQISGNRNLSLKSHILVVYHFLQFYCTGKLSELQSLHFEDQSSSLFKTCM